MLPPNPSEMLGSARIGEIISELTGEDTMVIIDAPPLNPVADAQMLMNNPEVHAAIVVARVARRPTRRSVEPARSSTST